MNIAFLVDYLILNCFMVVLSNLQVSRSLSGGMYVLGVFIVGPKDIFADKLNLQKVRSLINTIHSISKSNIYIFGSNQPKNLIVLYFSSQSKK